MSSPLYHWWQIIRLTRKPLSILVCSTRIDHRSYNVVNARDSEWVVYFINGGTSQANSKFTAQSFSFPTPRIPLNARSAHAIWLSITMTPYMAEPVESVTVYEGSIEFEEAVNAMADECLLYSYQGVFYNMPAQCELTPPFYCVTRGRYIGVFSSCIWWVFVLSSKHLWHLITYCRNAVKTELQVPGNHIANYVTVRSLVVGEQKVLRAIRRKLTASRWHQ